MTYKDRLEEYVNDFAEGMKEQLKKKRVKYGDTWKERPVEAVGEYDHQNKRFFDWFLMKYDAWRCGGEPINWFDVACEALICHVREKEERMKIVL